MSKRTILVLAFGSILALLVGAGVAFAASLPGSNFEIDNNANTKVDGAVPPSLDWNSVTEVRQADLASGQNDNSYGGGSKEDDTCPGVGTGSIPNNKSDLKTFGAYVESEANGPGYLNLYWTRVQDPSGTTLMDFELNQSSTKCANGVNPVRTAGDLLIEYRIEQGGAVASIKVREWTGSVWGPATDLTAANQAAGTINSTPILAADSGGLGALSARTFGEAQLDLDFIFDDGKCESFGSAFLKSRSSDSFTSQLKDFIAPAPVNITNCGKVIIRKQTDPDENPNATDFDFTKSFATDPSTANTFKLKDDGVQTFNNVLFGTGYTVTEEALPAGWDFSNLNCGASTGVTPSISGDTVTFAIDNSADVLDCTYTNSGRGNIVVEKVTNGGSGAFDFTSGTLSPSAFTLTTTAAGAAGKDSDTFSNLAPGTYDVDEDVPAGWDLTSATCNDGSNVGSISVSAGETVTCTFTNTKRGNIVVEKVTNGGSGAFDFTSGTLSPSAFTLTTTAAGAAGKDSDTFSNLAPGTYDVDEDVPAGWDLTSATCNDGSNVGSISVSAGETVTCTFTNTKRGNIVVEKVTNGGSGAFDFTSGTLSPSAFTLTTTAAGAAGKDSDTFNNLAPGTYDVDEDVPAGWDLTSATCSDNSNPGSIGLSAGETVTCTFTNTKKTTSLRTEQSFTPQDTAIIGGSGSGTFNGKVDFKLYKGTDCSGTPVYVENNVSLDGSNNAKTNNTTYTISDEGTGEYHWGVSYHDDTNGHPNASSCVEESTVTIDNDNTP